MNHLRITELLRLARMRLSNDVNVVLAAGKTLENASGLLGLVCEGISLTT